MIARNPGAEFSCLWHATIASTELRECIDRRCSMHLPRTCTQRALGHWARCPRNETGVLATGLAVESQKSRWNAAWSAASGDLSIHVHLRGNRPPLFTTRFRDGARLQQRRKALQYTRAWLPTLQGKRMIPHRQKRSCRRSRRKADCRLHCFCNKSGAEGGYEHGQGHERS